MTKSETEEIDKALSADEDESEMLVTLQNGKLRIPRYAFLTLQNGRWLNDDIMQGLFWKLVERECQNKNYYMSTHFLTKLQESGTYNHNLVRKWTCRRSSKVDIFEKRQIFIPCNINSCHWTLVVVDMRLKRIRYLDSQGFGKSTLVLEQVPKLILRYLKDEWEDKKKQKLGEMNWNDWRIDVNQTNIPQQSNNHDCGIFTFMNANFLSIEQELTFNQNQIDHIRPKLVLLLLDQWMLGEDGLIVRRND